MGREQQIQSPGVLQYGYTNERTFMKTYEDCYTIAATLIAAKEFLIKEYNIPLKERNSQVVVVPYLCLIVRYDIPGLSQKIADSTINFISERLKIRNITYSTFWHYLRRKNEFFDVLVWHNCAKETTENEEINAYFFEAKLKWIDEMIAEAKEKGI